MLSLVGEGVDICIFVGGYLRLVTQFCDCTQEMYVGYSLRKCSYEAEVSRLRRER